MSENEVMPIVAAALAEMKEAREEHKQNAELVDNLREEMFAELRKRDHVITDLRAVVAQYETSAKAIKWFVSAVVAVVAAGAIIYERAEKFFSK